MRERNCENCRWGQWGGDSDFIDEALAKCFACNNYDHWQVIRPELKVDGRDEKF